MERWHVKVLAIFITVILMLIAVFIPFKIVSKFKRLGSRGTRILDVLGCFTGGIFLGTCLLFLVPEVINLMSKTGFMGSFPIAEGVIAIGFVGVMFLERVVHSCRRTKKRRVNTKCCEENCKKNCETSYFSVDEIGNMQHVVKLEVCVAEVGVEENENEMKKIQPQEDRKNEDDEDEAEILVKENSTKAVILFMALSLDEFLGGISMGLQRTSTAVWGILVGLLAHETVVGFSFGLQLASLSKARTGCFAIVLGLSYALIGPLGAIVGTLLGEMFWTSEENIDSVNGVLQGLATGVFLYVTFFEILNGKIHSRSRYVDLIAVTIGISIMALIATLPKEELLTELDVSTTVYSTNDDDYS